ncbi:hypothetical protein HID58_029615 [Brassica napus]|uniref:ArsA/GET3 Anion-transporting ATPase-like domain-containing protein n=1 Tax=Brassica napus TaxID=3708 RepID=A0ABQ8CDM7_BRANA|nr:hypothetical protein HID58_029615 [Brassica napus]
MFGLGFSTDAVSMDPPRRNLPPSRRKIDVARTVRTKQRMPFLITWQAIDWYRSLNLDDMLNAASPEHNRFTHTVNDTAPTGHTLRLLSLSDFYDSSIGKIKLKKKITAAASAFTSVFGKKEIQQQGPSNELDQLKERMEKVLNVFSEVHTTEFVIVTIAPFSYLFIRSLVNMWINLNRSRSLLHFEFDCKFCSVRRKEQTRMLRLIQDDTKHLTRDILNSCCYKKQLHGWYELYSDN